jgi:VanZ like protein/concanavalin A-like lectin/glucanase superfamily protein
MMRKALGPICLFIVFGLLTAGLWPFNPFPQNDVSWLTDQNGLRFGDKATIFSSGTFERATSIEESFCSLEIWLQPALKDVNGSVMILAFYTPENPLQFGLKQYRDGLVVRDYWDEQKRLRISKIEFAHALRHAEPVLFTITLGPNGISAYLNGVWVKAFPHASLSCKDFSGQLVIGNSPTSYNTWQGKLFGVAIYNRQLSSELVWQHYLMWTHEGVPGGVAKDGVRALYSFGERFGRTIHNSIGQGPDLYIPKTFRILHKKILTPPWEEFAPRLSYVWDILINIVGFIPFGFFFCAYLTCNRQWNRAALVTVVLGGIISVTIEVLQAFIPSRMSGCTDIITNTLGASLGVLFWRWQPVQAAAVKLSVGRRQVVSGGEVPADSTQH